MWTYPLVKPKLESHLSNDDFEHISNKLKALDIHTIRTQAETELHPHTFKIFEKTIQHIQKHIKLMRGFDDINVFDNQAYRRSISYEVENYLLIFLLNPRSVDCTALQLPMFFLNMCYMYFDHTIDNPATTTAEKAALFTYVKNLINGIFSKPETKIQRQLYRLFKLMTLTYPEFESVRPAFLGILEAERSSMTNNHKVETMIEKGITTVRIIVELCRLHIDIPEDTKFIHQVGIMGQALDDLMDIETDLKENNKTYFITRYEKYKTLDAEMDGLIHCSQMIIEYAKTSKFIKLHAYQDSVLKLIKCMMQYILTYIVNKRKHMCSDTYMKTFKLLDLNMIQNKYKNINVIKYIEDL